MRGRWLPFWSSMVLLAACGEPPAVGGGPDDGDEEPPPPLCEGGGPLMVGDAAWDEAPFTPPGDMGQDEGDTDGDGEDSGGGFTSGGFIGEPDGGGLSFECDVWSQDCPAGEKCMPWGNDGGAHWNASRCSPIARGPGQPGDACTVEGSAYSGIDDCDIAVMCWDVDARSNDGVCEAQCWGSVDTPQCNPGQFCYLDPGGVAAVCLSDELCAADAVCQCMCPEGSDPDCEPDQCAAADADREAPDRLKEREPPPVHAEGDESTCPDEHEPVVLYMSNDDSNSQASPIVARRMISEGEVMPGHRVRIHEFLNYYDFNARAPEGSAVAVGMEMRRTEAAEGEFTLVLRAQAQQMLTEDRPPFNLVFSLDTSGSMQGEPMELLKDSMAAVVGQLRAGDRVSVVTWNDSQSIELEGYMVPGPDDPELLSIIEGLVSGGSTNLHQGLVTAYALANTYYMKGGINRVLLVSDGGANAGVTDLDLIASEAADGDDEGIYMIGVGVGRASTYNDQLMDAVTDAGKGAYVFVDRSDEAYKQLGDRFLANSAVVARDVRMQLTLPWYFGIKKFHGEEYSADPAEVEPQHLAPNDAMTFHQIVSACDASLITTCDPITARVEYIDPITGVMASDELTAGVEWLVEQPAPRLYKADVVVGYAKALIVISYLMDHDLPEQAAAVAHNMQVWAEQAATTLGDAEVAEIADIMGQYETVLGG